ncbi:hypothetical protein DZB91_24385 [Brevibacillus sp. VP]|uniref:hypothetical protein n=1 Tax=Brevibacillus sp. VP TaxID=2293326 RepID=UPI000E2EE540|nr:hypothetical protein [Brevibacillus sp. VP]RFB28214.1 hypothetical protein DZB91_24385 [Brevibacillus sp. VP]
MIELADKWAEGRILVGTCDKNGKPLRQFDQVFYEDEILVIGWNYFGEEYVAMSGGGEWIGFVDLQHVTKAPVFKVDGTFMDALSFNAFVTKTIMNWESDPVEKTLFYTEDGGDIFFSPIVRLEDAQKLWTENDIYLTSKLTPIELCERILIHNGIEVEVFEELDTDVK